MVPDEGRRVLWYGVSLTIFMAALVVLGLRLAHGRHLTQT
jgi:hypothetical protein